MPDANELVTAIKKAATEATEASKPVYVYFGKVTSTSPLQINVEQKMTLGEKQLVLSRNVTDYDVYMTVDHTTESALGDISINYSGTTEKGGDPEHTHAYSVSESLNLAHTHAYKGKKLYTVHNGLAVGDEVILLRQQEGQKFVVVDRIG